LQEQIVAPLEKAGIADLQQSEAARLDESAQQQDISILNYSPPDIEGMVNAGNERINSLIQQLDLQDRQRKAEAQDKYKGVSLADAMMQLDKEPEQGTLQRVFKQVGDYFGGAVFTDPRDGRQYTTPYVALTQRELGLPVTQKDGPPNIAGGLLYGLNAISAAPIAFAKDMLDQVNRTVHDVTQMMPWLKGTQDAATRWMQRNAPALAAQALKKRDESLARTAPGGTSNMMTMLRGGNYSLTDEMSTGSIGKIPGTKIDVDPGSLVGFAADVATGELVERGISAIVKQGTPALARTAVRGVTLPTLSSRAARRTRPAARPPTPPVQRVAPEVKAATIPDYRAVVVRPAGRGTGKAVVPTNPDRPVVVQTIQAVPDPVGPTRAYRSVPTPKYNQPKPTGPGGQFELPLTGVVQMPTVSSLLDDAPVRAVAVDAQQLTLPGVLPERQQFGMLGVEFHPDNTVVFKGLDDMFEDGDVIAARSFFKDLAEQGQTPLVKLTADLDETAWDNGFINALHMGFKPVANDGSFVNPNLIEFGSDVTLQLTPPGSVRVKRTNTVEDVLQRPDGARPYETVEPGNTLLERSSTEVPSLTARELYDKAETARPYETVEPGDTLVESSVPVRRTDDVPSPAVRDDNARPYETVELGDTLVEREVPGTSSALVRRTDSLVGNVPSPAARELYDTIETARHVYADPYIRRDDVSLRTMVGSLEDIAERDEGDALTHFRLLRDAGNRVNGLYGTRSRMFGDVELQVSHVSGDTYEVGFAVGGATTRLEGRANPVKDIGDMSKYIIDLHKANPEVRLVASIAASTDAEWAMKFRMYKRAGFVPVDEMGGLFTENVPPGTYIRLAFDPMSIEAGVLARRLASTETSIVRPGADPDFVELAAAVQMKEAIAAMRAEAEEVSKIMYDSVLDLRLPSRQMIEERPRLYVGTDQDITPFTSKQGSDYDYVYHGTRVQADNIAELDHINGGSPSSIGIGLHVTASPRHAEYHAMKAVNADLPADVPRTYGTPNVSRYAIDSGANILNADLELPVLSNVVREILAEIAPELLENVPPQLSVKSAIDLIDDLLQDDPAAIVLFQREFSHSLRMAGVDIVDAGLDARVVLNTEMLYDEGLNTVVRQAIDTPLAATRYADLAFEVDYKALRTERARVDFVESGFAHADQRVHEIANVQKEIAQRVDNAISQTTLWDYNGVPDPDNIPRYTPDPEPELRNAATPFDTQTADISPCTL
jgi:hypothetical protein